MRICVYCSSSSAVAEVYYRMATQLGRLIAERRHELVYGGCDVGVMGAIARAVTAAGGKVTGILPRRLDQSGLTYHQASEIILTDSMAERKAVMEQNADAFVALPGGLGTLDELAELLTLKQLGYVQGPVVIVNTQGFYDDLLAHFERLYRERFAKPDYRILYHVSTDPREVLDHIEHYVDKPLPRKWF
jgi:uncharacterized protein (TIGR00730 family)